MATTLPVPTRIEERQGTTWTWRFDLATVNVGDALPDLTACVITLDIGGTPGWTGSTATTGVTLVDAVEGIVDVVVPAGEDIAPGDYNGDLEVAVTATGQVSVPLSIRLKVLARARPPA